MSVFSFFGVGLIELLYMMRSHIISKRGKGEKTSPGEDEVVLKVVLLMLSSRFSFSSCWNHC